MQKNHFSLANSEEGSIRNIDVDAKKDGSNSQGDNIELLQDSPGTFNFPMSKSSIFNRPYRFSRYRNLVILLVIQFIIIVYLIIRSLPKESIDSVTGALNTGSKQSEIKLTKYMTHCKNGSGLEGMTNYIAIITVIKNKRMYLREWIEFYLMSGVTYFYFYDNGGEDNLYEFLKPYIDDGIVFYTKWPPKEIPNYEFDDKELENHFKPVLERCYNQDKEVWQKVLYCSLSACDDAIRRSRGKVRWLGFVDVDEYIYLSSNSPGATSSAPLEYTLKNLEIHHEISIQGIHYGTNGWISPPRRDDDQFYAPLVTTTHTRHTGYHLPGLANTISVNFKSFANPYCATGNKVHEFDINEANLPNFSRRIFYSEAAIANELNLFFNHYVWLSKQETYEKAIVNVLPETKFDDFWDRIINRDNGTELEYLMPKLEEKIKESIKKRPPIDGHADDWDYTLVKKHVYKPLEKLDLCVIIQSPRHIGLVRHSLKSIIYYFNMYEHSLNYKLIVHNSASNIRSELEKDFPIDMFITKDIDIEESCSAEYIMKVPEDSFARWVDWSPKKPAVTMAMKVFNEDKKVNSIYFTDSKNSMDEWNIFDPKDLNTTIRYRPNPGLLNKPGVNFVRKGVTVQDIYEVCLHQEDNCENNQIKSLFETYYQERMYGYKPIALE
ncbi:MAG: hypothetical protein EOP34_02355 [Rickettsiales bacterium]|nr:MAG: hypothetical protein EOP34_02355 [Rickettsiales bacterium]